MRVGAFTAVAIAAITAVTSSCGGGSSPTAPQVFTSLALSASSGAAYEFGTPTTLSATAKDASGAAIGNIGGTPTFTADPAGLVTITGNTVSVVHGATGTVQITASLTAQGKTLASPPVTVTVDVAPTSASITTSNLTFVPNVVHIKAGGTVSWSGLDGIHNVDFVNATPFTGAAANGAIGSSDTAGGAFAVAGPFLYHCDAHGSGTGGASPSVSGMSGRVVVH